MNNFYLHYNIVIVLSYIYHIIKLNYVHICEFFVNALQ